MGATSGLSVGLVHNWPNARNSEFELITRMRQVLEDLGHSPCVVDPTGWPLGADSRRLKRKSRKRYFDLVLNLHFLNPKYIDGLSYAVNWNPLGFLVNDPMTGQPLAIEDLNYIVDCFRSHDRILSAGSRTVDNYVASLRKDVQRPWVAPAELFLHTTTQAHPPPPATAGPDSCRVFYIGTNWEKTSGLADARARHEGLLELLGKSGCFEFYGVRELLGTEMWAGIDSYRGELPFDAGASIIERCRECGIALVLSSPEHIASGVVSTRIFQACAAQAVIIADRNPFIEEHFGDSIVYFDHGATASETAANILECVRWVKHNWPDAQAKAERSTKVFRERFDLVKQMDLICTQAQKDLASKTSFVALYESAEIHIVYVLRQFNSRRWDEFVANLSRQTHQVFKVHVFSSNPAKAQALADRADSKIECEFRNAAAPETLGACLTSIAELNGYMLCYSEGSDWSADHLFQLVAACRESRSDAAYCPTFVESPATLEQPDPHYFFRQGRAAAGVEQPLADLSKLNLNRFALGNALFASEFIRRALNEGVFLEGLDIASVHLLFCRYVEQQQSTPAAVAAITSRQKLGYDTAKALAYDEYLLRGREAEAIRARDRNALAMHAKLIGDVGLLLDLAGLEPAAADATTGNGQGNTSRGRFGRERLKSLYLRMRSWIHRLCAN